jgi:hypothetical protein
MISGMTLIIRSIATVIGIRRPHAILRKVQDASSLNSGV